MSNAVDADLAVSLAQQGVKPKQIAERLGVQPPAIYRAFRKRNYFTPGMLRQAEGPPSNFPPSAARRDYEPTPQWKSSVDAEEAEIAAKRIMPRDPCFRCGARGDYGCGCSKAPLGWRAG